VKKSVALKALVILPALCFAVAFAQVGGPRQVPGPGPRPAVGGPGSPVGGPSYGGGGVNAVAAYVFGEENTGRAEELAEAVVNNLAQSRKYSLPRRGAREFYRAADRLQARNRGKLLEDRDFCRIGGDEGVQTLVIIDIDRSGRTLSVWARLLDLDNCRIVGTAEYTGFIRNSSDIRRAADELAGELQYRRIGKRSLYR